MKIKVFGFWLGSSTLPLTSPENLGPFGFQRGEFVRPDAWAPGAWANFFLRCISRLQIRLFSIDNSPSATLVPNVNCCLLQPGSVDFYTPQLQQAEVTPIWAWG